jgi:hypothetical protein
VLLVPCAITVALNETAATIASINIAHDFLVVIACSFASKGFVLAATTGNSYQVKRWGREGVTEFLGAVDDRYPNASRFIDSLAHNWPRESVPSRHSLRWTSFSSGFGGYFFSINHAVTNGCG